MGHIDFTRSAIETERLVRAFTPWPGGYTYRDGRILKIKKCRAADGSGGCDTGVVTAVTKDEIFVACRDSVLAISALQPEGKKEMTVHDYLLGNPITVGEKFAK